MRANYLTGERVALRAMRLDDKEHAAAWYGGAFPIDDSRAEEFLREYSKDFSGRKTLLIVERVDGDELVGGVHVKSDIRHAEFVVNVAPWLDDADELRGDVVRLVVPWLRDEAQHITVTLDVLADQPVTIVAAESVGMVQTARFREWYSRPGGRIDRLLYQALNPFWERREATNA